MRHKITIYHVLKWVIYPTQFSVWWCNKSFQCWASNLCWAILRLTCEKPTYHRSLPSLHCHRTAIVKLKAGVIVVLHPQNAANGRIKSYHIISLQSVGHSKGGNPPMCSLLSYLELALMQSLSQSTPVKHYIYVQWIMIGMDPHFCQRFWFLFRCIKERATKAIMHIKAEIRALTLFYI